MGLEKGLIEEKGRMRERSRKEEAQQTDLVLKEEIRPNKPTEQTPRSHRTQSVTDASCYHNEMPECRLVYEETPRVLQTCHALPETDIDAFLKGKLKQKTKNTGHRK